MQKGKCQNNKSEARDQIWWSLISIHQLCDAFCFETHHCVQVVV
jgi:hypothetical protein